MINLKNYDLDKIEENDSKRKISVSADIMKDDFQLNSQFRN